MVIRQSATSKLLYAAAEIAEAKPREAGELGFTARLLAQTTLPHSNPGDDVDSFERSNGRVTLYIQSGPDAGLPYGSTPRLVLCWLITEAVRTKSRNIQLGDTLSAFMRELGMIPTGGDSGTITRLRDQVRRLFASRLVAVERAEGGERRKTMEIADDVALWWEPRMPDQTALWGNEIVLSERFYQEVTRRPIPLDLRALRALKRSPLGLDLYTWLCHRISYVTKPSFIPWRAIHGQFGADYSDVKNFKRKANRELRKISLLWPELTLEKVSGGIKLFPSQTHVPRKPAPLLGPASPEAG